VRYFTNLFWSGGFVLFVFLFFSRRKKRGNRPRKRGGGVLGLHFSGGKKKKDGLSRAPKRERMFSIKVLCPPKKKNTPPPPTRRGKRTSLFSVPILAEGRKRRGFGPRESFPMTYFLHSRGGKRGKREKKYFRPREREGREVQGQNIWGGGGVGILP